MDSRTAKSELRLAIKDRLSHISPKDRTAESRSLSRRILEALKTASAGTPLTICAYVPLTDEADIRPVLTELLTSGHHLFLPAYAAGKLVFRQATDLSTLINGTFGIPEPSEDSPELPADAPAIVLVPGRAFDRSGNRLGRGNGGYDIWIRAQRKLNPITRFWGVALECQVMSDIPTEAHDERVDAIVTARGLVQTTKA